MRTLVYCCEPADSELETALAHWPDGRAVPLAAWRSAKPPSILVVGCREWRGEWAPTLRQWATATLIICEDGDRTMIDQALDAGATTVITGPFDPQRLECVIHTTLSRHERDSALRRELSQTRQALADRPAIEKAKGLLMHHHRLSEEQAYGTLRDAAMKQQIRLADLARQLIETAPSTHQRETKLHRNTSPKPHTKRTKNDSFSAP